MSDESEKKALLQFPCEFIIKVFGKADKEFPKQVYNIIKKIYVNLNEQDIGQRLSKDRNYMALSIRITAESQAQLDSIYQALSKDPKVAMVI